MIFFQHIPRHSLNEWGFPLLICVGDGINTQEQNTGGGVGEIFFLSLRLLRETVSSDSRNLDGWGIRIEKLIEEGDLDNRY